MPPTRQVRVRHHRDSRRPWPFDTDASQYPDSFPNTPATPTTTGHALESNHSFPPHGRSLPDLDGQDHGHDGQRRRTEGRQKSKKPLQGRGFSLSGRRDSNPRPSPWQKNVRMTVHRVHELRFRAPASMFCPPRRPQCRQFVERSTYARLRYEKFLRVIVLTPVRHLELSAGSRFGRIPLTPWHRRCGPPKNWSP